MTPGQGQIDKFNTAMRVISLFGGRLSSLALCAVINYPRVELAVENELIELVESLGKNPDILRLIELLARAGAIKNVQPVSINKKEA